MNTLLELARLPQTLRGYGHVKENNLAAARTRQAYLLEQLAAPAVEASAVGSTSVSAVRAVG